MTGVAEGQGLPVRHMGFDIQMQRAGPGFELVNHGGRKIDGRHHMLLLCRQ